MLHFCRNGSVIAIFYVVYREEGKDKRAVVGKTVREEIIETGKLGQYDVTYIAVKGKIFYLFFPSSKPECAFAFEISRVTIFKYHLQSVLTVEILL